MNRLIQLLVRNQNLILFGFLQIIAFFWLFRTNSFHGASYFNVSQIAAAKVGKVASGVTGYINLKEKNENLALRITELENQHPRVVQEVYDSLKYGVLDTLKYKRKWKFYPAEIINKTARLIDNYMTLDRGKNGGVDKDLGVVNGEHIVGVVKKASENYSIVIPLINTQLKLGAKFKNNNYMGIVEWDKADIRTTNLINIPAFVNVQIGDTVVSSGFSSYFPEGLLIGKVSEIANSEADNTYILKLELFADYYNIGHVQVVKNLLYDEQKELEKTSY